MATLEPASAADIPAIDRLAHVLCGDEAIGRWCALALTPPAP